MADETSDLEELDIDGIDIVEEFYNAFHDKAGRFTFKKGGKRGKIHVPMSENARRSNAIMRSLSSARKSKEYKNAVARVKGSWADREKGQGGLRHVKGANSKKADAARAKNAVKGVKTKVVNKAKAPGAEKSENPRTPKDILSLTQRYGGR